MAKGNFSSRKKHVVIKALFPTGDVQRITGDDPLDASDGILVIGSKGSNDTDRRLMQERQFIMKYSDFKKNLVSELSSVGSYDDIAARDLAPESQQPSAMSFVRNAFDDPAVGSNIWGLYLYDQGAYVLIATEEDVVYTTGLSDSVEVSVNTGNFLAGTTTVGDIKGKSFSKIFDQMLFVSNPTISTAKSLVLTSVSPPTGNIEIGTTIDWSVSAVFNPGAIQNGDGSPGPNLVGDATLFTFTNPDASTTPEAAAGNTHPYTAPSYKIPSGTTTMSVQADHDAGTGLYYDSGGNPSTVLDPDRVAASINDAVNAVFSGKPLAFWAATAFPVNSAGVRAGAQLFLSTSATGVFNMTIPAGVTTIWFSVPAGKTIKVLYVESSNADVTSEFAASTFDVTNGGGAGDPVSYDTWESTIPGIGYPADATYNVTIS